MQTGPLTFASFHWNYSAFWHSAGEWRAVNLVLNAIKSVLVVIAQAAFAAQPAGLEFCWPSIQSRLKPSIASSSGGLNPAAVRREDWKRARLAHSRPPVVHRSTASAQVMEFKTIRFRARFI